MSTPEELITSGVLPGPEACTPVHLSYTGLDRGEPQRALDIRPAGGVHLRLLPDRGLDIVGAWYDGVPLHWSSRLGERQARSEFTRAFAGGLLVTCGLDNVGAASEGRPAHGTFNTLGAHSVTWSHAFDAGEVVTTVCGVIDDGDALDRFLRCERTITTRTASRTGSGLVTVTVTVTDVITNLSGSPQEAPMLYHVNLGPPLWQPGSTIAIDARSVEPRDVHAAEHVHRWNVAPAPQAGAPERVFEHHQPVPRVLVRGDDLSLELTWDADALPRLHQWVHPAAGVYALGVEPANCSVLGRAIDRARGTLPILAPCEQRRTSLRFTVHHEPAMSGSPT